MISLKYVFVLLSFKMINVQRCFAFDELAEDFGEVKFANVLFRHGDRTPIDPYPNDPYKNLSFWPEGYGQLTILGKRQEYALGNWLRDRYLHLVGDYNKERIYVQSTDMDRTLMSAECNLAALFPPNSSEKLIPSLPWQPVPIHTTPEHLDSVLAAKAPCPRYDLEMTKVKNSKEIQDLNKKYKDLFKYLTMNSGRAIENISEVEFLYDVLLIENNNNLTLPNWTASVFPHPMDEVARWSFALPTWNKELGKLKSGLLIGDMVKHFKDKHANKMNNRHLWFYSAHDSTVANLLNTLGVFDLHNPPYSATVLLELRVKNNQSIVTLVYRNSTTKGPYLLTIPGCSPGCPLDQFIKLTEDVIPKDWKLECHAHYFFDLTSDLPFNTIAIFAMVTSILLIFLLVTSMSFYWQRKKPKHVYHKLKAETI